MNKRLRILMAILVALICVVTIPAQSRMVAEGADWDFRHTVTSEGLECVVYAPSGSISCDWESYRRKPRLYFEDRRDR